MRYSLALTLLLGFASPAFAADHDHMNHGASAPAPTDEHAVMDEMFMKSIDVDGYSVTFHVMPSSDDMKSMGADSLMVKIEKDGAVVAGVVASSKVIFPDNTEVSHPMKVMGDWLMAGYDLAAEGRHQLMVLFKTTDGKKHFGGVHYPG